MTDVVEKEWKVDNLRVLVFPTRRAMGGYAAREAAEYIRELGREKGEICILFAAAPSQDEFLEALAREPDVPWEKVTAMQLDDYINIDRKAPQRFANYLDRHIFSKVPIGRLCVLDSQAEDTKEELKRYTAVLKEHPADISFIGIGENAHIAFNDPDKADFMDEHWIKAVQLDEKSRIQQVNDGCFQQLGQVPKEAMTVTIPPIMRASRVFCIVPGCAKANAVRAALKEDISSHVPATILRRHPYGTLYLDRESAWKIDFPPKG